LGKWIDQIAAERSVCAPRLTITHAEAMSFVQPHVSRFSLLEHI
jgi:hypothetical protein